MTSICFRLAATAAALVLLAGCGNRNNETYTQFYQIARQSLAASAGNIRITRKQAAEIPYASLGYRIDGGNEGLLVLATDTNGDQLWTSAAHVVLVTRGGRIVRSVGLGTDLSALTWRDKDGAPPPSAALKGAFSSTRQADYADLGLYGVTLQCRATMRGRQIIRILGQAIATVRVDEICESRTRNWSFTDSFWIDPDNGLAWRTRQHIHPDGGEIETTLLRPPG